MLLINILLRVELTEQGGSKQLTINLNVIMSSYYRGNSNLLYPLVSAVYKFFRVRSLVLISTFYPADISTLSFTQYQSKS